MIAQFSEQIIFNLIMQLHPKTKRPEKTWHKIYLEALSDKNKNKMEMFKH